MSLRIWAHNPGSRTASLIAGRLSHARVLASPETTRWTPRRNDWVINYGNSEFSDRITLPNLYGGGYNIINHPSYVNEMSNKLTALNLFITSYEDERADGEIAYPLAVVPFTSSRDSATHWVLSGYDVVCRHKLRGHSGDGIEIVNHNDYIRNGGLPNCPLYTRYVKKSREHRVHMYRNADNTCDFIWQEKKRRADCAEPDWAIRNYENGFIYAIEDVHKPTHWRDIEKSLEQIVQMQFSATDIITPNSTNHRTMREAGPMVLEVNSAPGIQSPTLLDWYVEHFNGTINGRS